MSLSSDLERYGLTVAELAELFRSGGAEDPDVNYLYGVLRSMRANQGRNLQALTRLEERTADCRDERAAGRTPREIASGLGVKCTALERYFHRHGVDDLREFFAPEAWREQAQQRRNARRSA